MKISLLVALSLASYTNAHLTVPQNDKIAFVFELIRHGARVPLWDDAEYFIQPTGNLTEQGMRQRYFTGNMERKKYIEDYKVIDDSYMGDQLYIQSTDIFRTLQSSYSELLGLYPPEKGPQITDREIQSLKSGKGMPPMKIRIGKELNKFMTSHSLIDGYVQIPVFTYTETTMKDDILYNGCKYVKDVDDYYYGNPSTFTDKLEIFLPILKEPLRISFNLTEEQADNLQYVDIYNYADILVSEAFQGVPPRYDFTPYEWFYVENAQKWALIMSFTDYSRQIMDPKMLRYPLQELSKTIDSYLNKDTSMNDLKYIIYSAHDYQIANLLEFIQFEKFDYYQVPYTSQVYFELHYTEECLKEFGDSSCFTIQIRFNGVPLQFEGCQKNENYDSHNLYDYPYICSFDKLVERIENFQANGSFEDLCNQKFVPPQ